MPEPTLHIWQISDRKRGHENQVSGVLQALADQTAVSVRKFYLDRDGRAGWLDFLRGSFPPARDELASGGPSPALVIGAGARTHFGILSAARATGARSVVLMKPARLIRPFFDRCIIPEHDRVCGSNVITTKGALNRVEPGSGGRDTERGLILIGGPSKHHSWDEVEIIRNLESLRERNPGILWTVTTSRRTPRATAQAVASMAGPTLKFVPFEQTDPDWLPETFRENGWAMVTEDSVSMLYEALTAGLRVGVLAVPRKRPHPRILRGLDTLLAEGRLFQFDPSVSELTLQAPERPRPLNEAGRVAALLKNELLKI